MTARRPIAGSELTEALLRAYASDASFQRGAEYARNGNVLSLVEEEGRLTASVRGERVYRVELTLGAAQLRHRCSCPVSVGGQFCKHCVAVGLVWIAHQTAPDGAAAAALPPVERLEDLRGYVESIERKELVELLLGQASKDATLRRRLFQKSAKQRGAAPPLETYRQGLRQAFDAGRGVAYADMHAYCHEIEGVVDSIEELLEDDAAGVITLTELGLTQLEQAYGKVDDSDGLLGAIRERLEELHFDACESASPDPAALAVRLLELQLSSEWEVFDGAYEEYRDVLGDVGRQVYRVAAAKRWAELPGAPSPPDNPYDGRRARLRGIMQMLARESGDLEAYISIIAVDLSSPSSYLQIAEACQAANRRELALSWAEQGLAAFPDRTDPRLRDFVIAKYRRRRRHDEALGLLWQAYVETPSLPQYQSLKQYAEKRQQWPRWHTKALEELRRQLAPGARRRAQAESRWEMGSDRSNLVEILLWEGECDTAWEEAQWGGCARPLWLQLASLREGEHPGDALAIYSEEVDSALSRQSYAEVVQGLETVRALMVRMGDEEGFRERVQGIRTAHGRKRKLMALLDQARWERS